MKRTWSNTLGILAIAMIIPGCSEEESKVKKAVEEVVTQEFKIYEGAKRSLDEVEKTSQERKRELELLK